MNDIIIEVKQDCLIGRDVKPENIKPIISQTIEYFEETVGNVKVTLNAYNELMKGSFERYILAGITRNAYENKEEPPLFNSNFIREGYKTLNPPIDFKEKARHLLKFMYENGGRENKKFEFNSTRHFTIAYSKPEEFIRIVEYLEKLNWIDISTNYKMGDMGSQRLFKDVEMTIMGQDEIEKQLPQIPLVGLVDQKITTGNIAVDEKINHAKNLFFKDGSTLDDKRSACETLSFVLEPLRGGLSTYFSSSDVSDFFKIVNRFDIRHNKDHTISIVHEEQLEWIFYSLLNTINAYTKLEARLGL